MNGAAIPIVDQRPAELRARTAISWVATVDHKRIGILYLATTFVFFLIGGVEALVMRCNWPCRRIIC